MKLQTDRQLAWARRSAEIALGCFGYFSIVLVLQHGLRPDYTPVDHMISDYAVGRFGWIMTTAFVALALGCLTLGLGMAMAGPRSLPGRAAVLLLWVATLGLLVTATFPTDLETAVTTTTGNIHTASFLVNVISMILCSLLFAISFHQSEDWRGYRWVGLAMAIALLAAFVAQFLTLHRGAPYGLTNRLFVAVLMVWLLATARQLRRIAMLRHGPMTANA
jgi:disulfide bond formation protein DsbB